MCEEHGCGCRFKKKGDLTKHAKREHKAFPTTDATRRIRVYPSTADKAVLRQWFGSYRTMYNAAVEHCNTNRVYGYNTVRPILSNETNLPASKPWLKMLPSACRKLAVQDACNAFASNFAIKAKNPGHRFEVHMRRKKDVQQLKFEMKSMSVQGSQGGRQTIRLFRTMGILSTDGFGFDCKNIDMRRYTRDPILQMDKLGKFMLILPYDRPLVENQDQGGPRGQCALDPGVRTFMTTYSPDGTAFKLGDRAATRIYRLMLATDTMYGAYERCSRQDGSKMSKVERRRLKAKINSNQQRINNLVDELHWQAASFLVKRYELIVIPPFETAKMSAKYDAARGRRRRVGRKTVRQMLRLRHYVFRQRLIHLAKVYGSRVVVMGEEYTSKTCTHCGNLHHALGGSKRFTCPACGISYDRDAGGSRNIFLKNLVF